MVRVSITEKGRRFLNADSNNVKNYVLEHNANSTAFKTNELNPHCLNTFPDALESMSNERITDSGEIKLYLVQILSETGDKGASETFIANALEKLNCSDSDYKEVLNKEIEEKRILKKKEEVYFLNKEIVQGDLAINLQKEHPVLGLIGSYGEVTLEQIYESFKNMDKKDIDGKMREYFDKNFIKKEKRDVLVGSYKKPLVDLVKETLEKRGKIKDGKGLLEKTKEKINLPERKGKD